MLDIVYNAKCQPVQYAHKNYVLFPRTRLFMNFEKPDVYDSQEARWQSSLIISLNHESGEK